MNPYEEILNTMREQGKKDNTAPIQIGVMESATTCAIGALKLSGSDLLIAEHLKTGYHYAVDNATPSKKDKNTFIGALKKGDKVAVYRVSDELYIILERIGVKMSLLPTYIEDDEELDSRKKAKHQKSTK